MTKTAKADEQTVSVPDSKPLGRARVFKSKEEMEVLTLSGSPKEVVGQGEWSLWKSA
jgi:hypothetical protein